MLGFVMTVVGVLLVAALLFLGASLLLGRGETQPAAEPDRSPVELPDDRPVVGDDVRALRLSVAVRGYRMTEVDWLLEQLAETLDERDAALAELRSRLDRDADTDPGVPLPSQPRQDGVVRETATGGNGAPAGA